MAKKLYHILITMAVISFTALSIYRVELKTVPSDYADLFAIWEKKFHTLTCFCFLILIVCYFSKYVNQVIRFCLLTTASLNIYLLVKLKWSDATKHFYSDWTCMGVIIIGLFFGCIVIPNIKSVAIFIKALTNQIYMKWQRNYRKKDGSSEL